MDGPMTWIEDAHRAIAEAAPRLTDDELAEPSLLPGWTRAHVLAHLARNADGRRNLVTWARTRPDPPRWP